MQSFVNEADRKTDLAKKRLSETQEELTSEVSSKLNRIHELAEEIGKKLAAAEKLGAEGNVEESIRMMEEVEEVKKEKVQAELDYRNSMPASSYQQQKLRVCEVCSAYLGIHDNDRRLADHFGGKLHLGFISIREKLEELKKVVAEKREKGLFDDAHRGQRDNREDRNRSGRDRRDRYDRGGRDRRDRRSRSRSRDRSYRDRREDRYRSSRDRSRSRSPDRRRRRYDDDD